MTTPLLKGPANVPDKAPTAMAVTGEEGATKSASVPGPDVTTTAKGGASATKSVVPTASAASTAPVAKSANGGVVTQSSNVTAVSKTGEAEWENTMVYFVKVEPTETTTEEVHKELSALTKSADELGPVRAIKNHEGERTGYFRVVMVPELVERLSEAHDADQLEVIRFWQPFKLTHPRQRADPGRGENARALFVPEVPSNFTDRQVKRLLYTRLEQLQPFGLLERSDYKVRVPINETKYGHRGYAFIDFNESLLADIAIAFVRVILDDTPWTGADDGTNDDNASNDRIRCQWGRLRGDGAVQNQNQGRRFGGRERGGGHGGGNGDGWRGSGRGGGKNWGTRFPRESTGGGGGDMGRWRKDESGDDDGKLAPRNRWMGSRQATAPTPVQHHQQQPVPLVVQQPMIVQPTPTTVHVSLNAAALPVAKVPVAALPVAEVDAGSASSSSAVCLEDGTTASVDAHQHEPGCAFSCAGVDGLGAVPAVSGVPAVLPAVPTAGTAGANEPQPYYFVPAGTYDDGTGADDGFGPGGDILDGSGGGGGGGGGGGDEAGGGEGEGYEYDEAMDQQQQQMQQPQPPMMQQPSLQQQPFHPHPSQQQHQHPAAAGAAAPYPYHPMMMGYGQQQQQQHQQHAAMVAAAQQQQAAYWNMNYGVHPSQQPHHQQHPHPSAATHPHAMTAYPPYYGPYHGMPTYTVAASGSGAAVPTPVATASAASSVNTTAGSNGGSGGAKKVIPSYPAIPMPVLSSTAPVPAAAVATAAAAAASAAMVATQSGAAVAAAKS